MLSYSHSRTLLGYRSAVYFLVALVALILTYSRTKTVSPQVLNVAWASGALLLFLLARSFLTLGRNRGVTPERLALAVVEVIAVSILVATTGASWSLLLVAPVLFVVIEHGHVVGVVGGLSGAACAAYLNWNAGSFPVALPALLLGLSCLGFFLRPILSEVTPATVDERLEQANRVARVQSQAREKREQELFEERRRFESLVMVAQGIATIREEHRLLAEIVSTACRQLDTESAVVFLVDEGEMRVAGALGLFEMFREKLEGPVHSRFLGQVLQQSLTLTYDYRDGTDLSQIAAVDKPFKELVSAPQGSSPKLKNFIVTPLETPHDSRPFGLLMTANRQNGQPFKTTEEGYLKILAMNAAVGIKNIQATSAVERSLFEMIQALAQAIEAKDTYTSNHVVRVRNLAVRLGEIWGLERNDLKEIGIAATLHDVGKISTPDKILGKAGPLDEEEYRIMKSHAERGASILEHIRSLPRSIYKMVMHHHERWDGKGYPAGLKGDQIPLGAQMISIADCFDAMTTNRPYRKGFEPLEALKRMEEGCGTQFNSELLCAFFALHGYQPRTNPVAVNAYQQVVPRLQLCRPSVFDFPAIRGGDYPTLGAGAQVKTGPTKEKVNLLQIEPKRPRV